MEAADRDCLVELLRSMAPLNRPNRSQSSPKHGHRRSVNVGFRSEDQLSLHFPEVSDGHIVGCPGTLYPTGDPASDHHMFHGVDQVLDRNCGIISWPSLPMTSRAPSWPRYTYPTR